MCPPCHHGTIPLDQELGFCAGDLSTGLVNALALVSVQLPFEEAAQLVRQLTGVSVRPNTIQEVTKSLGREVIEAKRKAVEAPIAAIFATARTREEDWKGMKIGAFYTTTAPLPPSGQIRGRYRRRR